ncbi:MULTISPECIES: Gfo/Idh/MocA family oxidoreductase [Petrimonas]|jgi:predicted dehydrogenase|uniref:Glycosyl hydrolase family 109 protein n=3 Tax=Petrimonas mucosa TaxID=1642646 RepID=A0A1G4G605_9BACT|nr:MULTISPECIES: Gfo/Idh/MocA family oxidoreductase [Petrimonas]MDD3560438.1 Gfo/Idh/MocA family oxidoreductase [Petrimonas mucosa]SCM56991.1 Glycosyl hydrolase family 109 protein [Petrimonas mucosa]SFU50341.1 Tat (twin-arginine translocation) pathway signal sequence [Porphyromonadaceae bacterium KHP3R9]HHT29727.1 Gfo/Idh/MocA family oxidoreductase [Petrimonas mucosa]
MSNQLTRRKFLKTAAIGAVGVAVFPQFVASCQSNKKSDGIIRLGFIGLGQQAMYLLNGFMGMADVEVVAGCDVYGIKRERFLRRVNDYYTQQEKRVSVEVYENYKDLIARDDIDAVVIATPDHWHAFIAIAACNAKKNVYLEKPLTFTIREGQELVKAVRKNKVILAVGSQQRSDPNFQHAVKMVQEGKIGKIEKVNAYVGAPPTPYDLPEEPVPADLNWPLWLGPSEYVHYNSQLNPPISLDPEQKEQFWGAWRWYKELGGGFTTDWGAHMFDIAQWGLGMDNSGPVEIIPAGYEDTKFLTFKYANGVVMTEEPFDEKQTKGVKFWGDKGWIEVSRGHFLASDDSLLPPKVEATEGAYETKVPHLANFIQAVKTKTDPVVPVEIGHRTCTVCTLGNIAYDLMRPIKWDPAAEKFVDDPEAEKNRLFNKTYTEGYKL